MSDNGHGGGERPYAYKFIVLEGIDGGGKTTVSRELARSINAKLFRTPPQGFGGARRHIDAKASLNPRFLFYLSSVAHAADAIRQCLTSRHVVCDRYLTSTVAYHRAFGLKLDWDFDQLGLVKPDYTFFLEVGDESVRRRRLLGRGKYTLTDAILDDDAVRSRLLDEYLKYPMLKIDTAPLTVEEVVYRIRAATGL